MIEKSHATNKPLRKQLGAAILIITVLLLVAVVLMTIYLTLQSRLQQKSATNAYANAQAFYAADAGLNYGLAFLNQYSSTVLASALGGYISYGLANLLLTNVALSDGATFSVTFTNPTANNYQLLQITSVGTNSDGTATRTVREQVYEPTTYITSTAMSAGDITFVGGSTLTNTISNVNVQTGGTVTINNGAATYTSSGQSSYQGHIASDVVQNVSSLQGLSESTFFQNVFGTSEAAAQSAATASGTYYSNAGADYSQTLKGVTGKTIFISQTNGQTVTLGQGVTIGSITDPVTLIVEGNLNIANGVTIYGFVYSSSPSAAFSLAGGAVIYGGIASAGQINISNGFQLTYVKDPVMVGSTTSGYYPVSGSWKDF